MARGIRNLVVMAGLFLLFAGAVGVVGAQRSGGQEQAHQLEVRGAGFVDAEQGPGPRGPWRELREEFSTRLAAKLGVSEEALRSAFRETMEEMRPQMREHMKHARDRMREGRERGDDGPGDRRPGRFFGDGQPGGPGAMGGRPGVPPPVLSLSADILRLEPDALRQQLEAGKTLAQLAQERGIPPDALAEQIAGRMEQMRAQQMREMVRAALDRQFGQP